MAKTLLARISRLDQYDTVNKVVRWSDPTESRWTNVYGQLQVNDNAIFIGVDKLLIGYISKIDAGNSIEFTDIQEINSSNDRLLQLHQIYPELISRVKANFLPFIHPKQIDIKQLVVDANDNKVISFYIILGEAKYSELADKFSLNDRIVLINNNNQFDNVKLHSKAGLINFPTTSEVNVSVKGLTLDEVLTKNKIIKRKSIKSNNILRIQNIINAIAQDGIFKFKTFNSYYDCLFNKKVYGEGLDSINSKTNRIVLQESEVVYKVSMGSNNVSEEAFNYCNDNNLIIVHKDTLAKATSSQTQGAVFANQVKVGDYFYLCRGNNNFEVIGRISGDAAQCDFDDLGIKGWLQRPYELIAEAVNEDSYQDDKKWWTPNDNSTFIAIPKHEIDFANTKLFLPFYNTQFEYEGRVTPSKKGKGAMHKNLNQILFGPPGTGKTYQTINKALEILGENIAGKTREEVKIIFDTKVNEGQIVFTTFHQSMSYEDFIEGIKPIEPDKEGDPVIYRTEFGVFRNLCIEASFAIAQSKDINTTGNVLNFSILYDSFAESVNEKLSNGKVVELTTKTGGTVLVDSISQQGNFVIKHHDGIRTYSVSKARLTKLHSAIENLGDVSNINHKFREIIGGSNSSAYWAVLNAIRNVQSIQEISKEDLKYTLDEKKEVVSSLSKADYKDRDVKRFVIIIDEINRGNVSQIFGELITLIEEDKRLGNEEALEAILPYSKERFGVPPNLHIIGTMNTADRSVEALDAALRRRFSFEEMPPKPILIATDGLLKKTNGFLGNIELPVVLSTINRRIEKLLDKDHLIGHSYFMTVTDIEELKVAFHNKIIPLLQEYFFGDYGKIGLILGRGFFEPLEPVADNVFADFDDYDSSELAERSIFKIRNVAEITADEFLEAIEKLLNS